MRSCLRFALIIAVGAHAGPASAARLVPLNTRAYIDHAWGTLTRSMEDCSALADSKVGTRPVLYLPADLPRPPRLDGIARHCHIDVRVLPRTIGSLGAFSPEQLPVQGLLYLPNPYVVPGGFFNEMYGWDSYFIVLGLIADHRDALARGMVDNALFEAAHYGAVLNANRTYYLTRSQPPFLSSMMRAVLDDPASFGDKATARTWLAQAYPLAVRDHATWMRREHRAGDTGLARYFGYGGASPVLEMRDASYLRGVIDWLIAHRARGSRLFGQGLPKPGSRGSGALGGDELRCTGLENLRRRLVERLSPERGLLSGRPRDARIRFRHHVSHGSVRRLHAPLRAGGSEQPALSL